MQQTKTLEYQPRAEVSRFGFGAFVKVAVVGLSVIAALPAAILLHTYACYFSDARYLGHFPTYAHPDPGTLPPGIMFGGWLMPFGFAATISVIILVCFVMLRSSVAQLSVAFGCAALFWILLAVDLGGAFNWIMD